MEEELCAGIVDNEQINYELGDLHGCYVALPLSIDPHKSIPVGRDRMNGTYPEPSSTSSSVVVVICIEPWHKYWFKRAFSNARTCVSDTHT